MPDVARDEIPELRALRDDYDRARDALMAGIHKAMSEGETNARIARSVDWTREYIAKIRAAKPSASTSKES
jgi:hypothetical protein